MRGITSAWKQKLIVTSNEKSYLDFLYHDRNILLVQEIGVHPYWLQASGENVHGIIKPASNVDLSHDWLQLLTLQALNCYVRLERQDAALEFLGNIQTRINGIARANNAPAISKIDGEIALIKKIMSKVDAQQKIDEIYDTYALKAQDNFAILKAAHQPGSTLHI